MTLSRTILISLLFILLCCFGQSFAEEAFTFNVEEFDNKPFSLGGFAELNGAFIENDTDSAMGILLYDGNPDQYKDQYGGHLQLNGKFTQPHYSLHGLMQASAVTDDIESDQQLEVFEGYVLLNPTHSFSVTAGKKSFKWGKGYAWNPVGIINRQKDINDPEKSQEGFIVAGVEYIQSFNSRLQNITLTAMILPVREDLNNDFGTYSHNNLAAKLYLLWFDTDIDFVYFSGNSRPTVYGIDMSKNIAPHFEIHGEYAHSPDNNRWGVSESDTIESKRVDAHKWLIGLRYLSENNMTSIVEYYHNSGGYTGSEMKRFYQLATDGVAQYDQMGDDTTLSKVDQLVQKGFGKSQPGKNYLYYRLTQKEPFDLLYVTPGITTVFNMDDHSFSVSPEITYTRITNMALRAKASVLSGKNNSEYGEKPTAYKLEFRARYYF